MKTDGRFIFLLFLSLSRLIRSYIKRHYSTYGDTELKTLDLIRRHVAGKEEGGRRKVEEVELGAEQTRGYLSRAR